MAGFMAHKNVLLPTFDLWEVLLPSKQAYFHEDNQAMLRICQTGRNPTMRHLNRVHRVSVAWMYERLGDPRTKDPVEMIDTQSSRMAADIYTKAFTDADKWDNALKLINIIDPAQLEDFVSMDFAAERDSNSLTRSKTNVDDDSGDNPAIAASLGLATMNESDLTKLGALGAPKVYIPTSGKHHGKVNRRFAEIFSGVGHLAQAYARMGIEAEAWDIMHGKNCDLLNPTVVTNLKERIRNGVYSECILASHAYRGLVPGEMTIRVHLL